MSGASIEQSGFAGNPQPTGHGTAVASLIVGNQGPFRGAAQGASLFVADVYGGSRAAGSASSVVRALGWLASKRPQVINISLVGPQNRLVERAIQVLRARGVQIVAAVGNDGPAAPPQYPASYPGVVSVTGVDARHARFPRPGRPRIWTSQRPARTWPRRCPVRDIRRSGAPASRHRWRPRGLR